MTTQRRNPATRRNEAGPQRPVWTIEAVRALGVTTDLVTAGQILGLSRNVAYALARDGTFPVPLIKAGTRYRVPVAAILTAVHATPAAAHDTWDEECDSR